MAAIETIRIKDIPTTATTAAADDYIVIDGATNKVRKGLASNLITATAAAAVAGHDASAGAHGNARAKKLDRWLRLATYGDSTADYSAGGTDVEVSTAAFPGSGSTGVIHGCSKATISQFQPTLVVANGGIVGQNTQSFVDRGKGAYSATRKALQDVLRKFPDVVEFNGGSINDYSGMTTTTPQAAIDAVVERHRQCAEYFTSAGVHVIDAGTYGYSVPGANLSAICGIIVQTNAAIMALAAANPLWHYVEMSGVTHDGTGLFLPAATTDNIHLNQVGAYRAGYAKKTVLDTLFLTGPQGEIAWDQQSAYASATTNIPNLALEVSNATIVTKIFRSDSALIQVVAQAGGSMSPTIYGAGAVALLGLRSGDKLALETFIEVFDSSGAAMLGLPLTSRVYLRNSDNSVGIYFDQYQSSACGAATINTFHLPVDASALGANTYISTGITFPTTGTYTVKLRPFRIWKYTARNTLPA